MVDTSQLEGLNFVIEIDKLKGVLRQSLTHDKARRENTAEHSWHLSTATLVFQKFSNSPIHLERALKMALVHDIVEIDAGDTFVYDAHAYSDKEEREKLAAKRLFGLLPTDLGQELEKLWHDFEKQKCPESLFVAAIDRFLPVLANYKTEGHSWKIHKIKVSQVLERNSKIKNGSEKLWELAKQMIDDCVAKGHLLIDS